MKQDGFNVCVVIAARNAASTIGRAVSSALRQDHVSEVIVVDDASTDATLKAALAGNDGSGRLKTAALIVNSGPAAARNHALFLSASSHFTILDADDYMLPGRMKKLLSRCRDDWDMIADDLMMVAEDAAGTDLSAIVEQAVPFSRMLGLEEFVRRNLPDAKRPRGELGFLKPVVSRQFMLRHSLKYRENLRLGEDYALYVEALRAGARFQLQSACGYVAVERPNSLSHRHTAKDLNELVKFDDLVLGESVTLSGPERDALLRHRGSTWKKAVHGAVLDRKSDAGYLSALALLARSPVAIPHVIARTIAAKSGRLRQKLPLSRLPQRPARRFLIGEGDIAPFV